MKKKYTRKQICEAIAYWKKQLNESAEGGFTCPHCHGSFSIIALIDNDDNTFETNGPAKVECVKSRTDELEIRSVLRRFASQYGLCDAGQFVPMLKSFMQNGYVDCSEFGGDDWRVTYI